MAQNINDLLAQLLGKNLGELANSPTGWGGVPARYSAAAANEVKSNSEGIVNPVAIGANWGNGLGQNIAQMFSGAMTPSKADTHPDEHAAFNEGYTQGLKGLGKKFAEMKYGIPQTQTPGSSGQTNPPAEPSVAPTQAPPASPASAPAGQADPGVLKHLIQGIGNFLYQAPGQTKVGTDAKGEPVMRDQGFRALGGLLNPMSVTQLTGLVTPQTLNEYGTAKVKKGVATAAATPATQAEQLQAGVQRGSLLYGIGGKEEENFKSMSKDHVDAYNQALELNRMITDLENNPKNPELANSLKSQANTFFGAGLKGDVLGKDRGPVETGKAWLSQLQGKGKVAGKNELENLRVAINAKANQHKNQIQSLMDQTAHRLQSYGMNPSQFMTNPIAAQQSGQNANAQVPEGAFYVLNGKYYDYNHKELKSA